MGTDDKRAKQIAVAERILLEVDAVEGLSSKADNRAYHANGITNAVQQFEDEEVTVSHAYRTSHPGLAHRSYGEAFFDVCHSRGAISRGMRILEIGGGTGSFARSFLDRFAQRLPEEYSTAAYTMFELSPVLVASQRILTLAHAERMAFEGGDIETHEFSKRFDLVIANEMIADLSVEAVDKNGPRDASYATKYNLSNEGGLRRFLVNVGAIRLLEQTARVLSPDGHAIVTEYGSRDAFPVAIEVGGHTEYTIHFGHLEQAATALGLRTRFESLQAFLQFDKHCEVIATDSLILIRELATRIFGRELPTLAYTRTQLRETVGEAVERIWNLRFVALGDRASFMCPAKFHALSMQSGPRST